MHTRVFLLIWILFVGLVAAPACARATSPADQWFSVLLDGRKIGTFESTREVRDSRVMTTQTLDMELDRAGSRVTLHNAETSTETTDGKPLAFRSVSQLSGSETIIEGRVREGSVSVTTRNAGTTQRRHMTWPHDALLPEGLRRVGLRAGLKPGTRYQALSFQPSSLDAVQITSVVGARENVELPGGDRQLSPIAQTIAFAGAPMGSRAWVDEDQTVYKLTMPLMGVDLVMLACDRACATAANQSSDIFTHTLVPSPVALGHKELAGTVRYTLAPRDHGALLGLPETDEQHVVHNAGQTIVTVQRAASSAEAEPPAAGDYKPNDWLQSNAPEIVRLARRAVGDEKRPLAQMQRLETFVRSFIAKKSLGIGYASALEVARKPEGDCTEHAVLLAALGRALGIATRVADGLAYAPGFAGKDQVFVPHAWMQAWIDGRWQSFDAALAGFDSGHIALGLGDGDPWRFYSGLDMLGRIDLRKVESVTAPAD